MKTVIVLLYILYKAMFGCADVCSDNDMLNTVKQLRELQNTLQTLKGNYSMLDERVNNITTGIKDKLRSFSEGIEEQLNSTKHLQSVLKSTIPDLQAKHEKLEQTVNQNYLQINDTLSSVKSDIRTDLDKLQRNISELINGDVKELKNDLNGANLELQTVVSSTIPQLRGKLNDLDVRVNKTTQYINKTLYDTEAEILSVLGDIRNVSESANKDLEDLKTDLNNTKRELQNISSSTIPSILLDISSLNQTVETDIQKLNDLDIPTLKNDLNLTMQSVQTNSETMSTVNQTFVAIIQSIENDIKKLKENATEAKQELNQIGQTSYLNFTDLKMNVNLMNETLTNLSQSTENDINKLRATYERLEIKNGSYVEEPRAFFLAKDPSETTVNGSAVVFTHVDYNQGGGYNSSNGRFTVNDTGLYAFTYQVCGYSGLRCKYELVHNDTAIFNSIYTVLQEPSCSSFSVFVELYDNDQVWVAAKPDSNCVLQRMRDSPLLYNSIFSGALIVGFR